MFDMITSMGVSPLSVTLAVIVLGVPLSLLFMVGTMPKNNGGEQGFQQKCAFNSEKRWFLINKVQQVYSTFNLKTIQNITSEMMFMMTTCSCKIMERVGIRKEVDIQPDAGRDKIATSAFASSDGKNDLLVDTAYCSYTERYLDNVSDKVLFEKKWPKAVLVLTALKAAHMDGPSAKFCTQCGAPISLTGDFYHCDHCGAHYQSDAYEWTVTGIQPQNEQKNGIQTKMIGAVVVGTLCLSLISLFVSFGMLHLLVYLLDAAMVLGMVWYLAFMKKNIQGIKDCSDYDPMFSRQEFQRRVEYLYRFYRQATDLDVTLIQPFMDKESYAKLEERNILDDFYYLDNNFYQLLTPGFKIADGKQWMDCYLTVDEMTVNKKRKISKKREKIHMILMRDQSCKNNPRINAELYICENCGASINLSMDGKCRHCGTPIDMLKHDWCIYKIEEV